MSDHYVLKVKYTHGDPVATWSFNGPKGGADLLDVDENDTVEIEFEESGTGSDEVTQAVLLSGPLAQPKKPLPALPQSPFTLPSPIDLVAHPTLTLATTDGLWGFTVAFAAADKAGATTFYCVPDPELQVGSTPGGTRR